ncbi:hypothetical protein MRX96_046190 [Rhipicephalus microplus]
MIGKIFILLCLTAYAAGQVVVEPVRQEEAPPQPYSFRYDTTDEFGSRTTREETSDENNNKVGSYSYVDANGISRTVRYVADAEGFHVTIETNEPGTRTSNPAQAQITSTAVEPPPEGRSCRRAGLARCPSRRSCALCTDCRNPACGSRGCRTGSTCCRSRWSCCSTRSTRDPSRRAHLIRNGTAQSARVGTEESQESLKDVQDSLVTILRVSQQLWCLVFGLLLIVTVLRLLISSVFQY